MMRAAVVFALLFVAVINAASQFSFNSTVASTAYSIVGNAHVDTASKSFVITEATTKQVGALWINQPIKLANGFQIDFTFKITHNPSNTTAGCRYNYPSGNALSNADGLVFVLNAQNTTAYGHSGETLGYDFNNNFAIEFDTYANSLQNDPAGFHIGVQSCGRNPNSANHNGPCKLANPVSITGCYDNVVHTASIVYSAVDHRITVAYDGQVYFNFTYNIGSNMDLINGDSVYAGFTSSTGNKFSRHEFFALNYQDLNQIVCPAGQLVNYADNTCYTPTTAAPSTAAPTTAAPTTAAPTETPLTPAPTTAAPTTAAPTTAAPTTEAPTTAAPTTAAPTTEAPTTAAPTTAAPTTEAPTTAAPTTAAPTTEAPTTAAPTTAAPTTEAPTTAAPTTEAPTTAAPTTEAPTTAAPTTAAPTTAAPASACDQTSITVTNGDELENALKTHCNIVLANGTYYPTTKFVVYFNGTKISSTSTASINCGGSEAGQRTYVIGVNENDPPILIGLYLAGVVGVEVSGLRFEHCETGIYADWYTEATFTNVYVANNFNHISIGSGFHTIYTSVVTIVDSIVENNVGYAGIFVHGTATVRNTKVRTNSGGGVAARYSAVVSIDASTIELNYGSGVYSERSSSVAISNTVIQNNYGSWFGGGIWAESGSTITVSAGSTISGNTARTGGGIYARTSSVTVSADSVVSGNTGTVDNTNPDQDIQ